jgi:hypothetical protein
VTFHGIGVEVFCFFMLLACCLLAVLAWLVGMARPKAFGHWPAALWIGLLSIALVCSAAIGFFEFVR